MMINVSSKYARILTNPHLCGECLYFHTRKCSTIILRCHRDDLSLPTDQPCENFYALKDRVKQFRRDKPKMVKWVKARKEGTDNIETWGKIYAE